MQQIARKSYNTYPVMLEIWDADGAKCRSADERWATAISLRDGISAPRDAAVQARLVGNGERAWRAVSGFAAICAQASDKPKYCGKCSRELGAVTTFSTHQCFVNAFGEPPNRLRSRASLNTQKPDVEVGFCLIICHV